MATADRISAIRSFNRFYTRRIGLLNDALLGSDFSLAEMRVLWELAHDDAGVATASFLKERLGMDAGYLSRILKGFRDKGLLRTTTAEHDARIRHLVLSEKGKRAFLPLDRRSGEEVRATIANLSEADQARVVQAMGTIEALLEGKAASRTPFVLRDARVGDYGWTIHRHGALYAEEYGWDATFEALVAEIVSKYIRNYKPEREHCWVAERGGEIVGCVYLVERSPTVAQLRLLLVEPSARGLGIGSALVDECLRFARAAGYRRMMLWTNSNLHSARRIYERAGFRLVKSEKHHSFGHDLVGQNWEKSLRAASVPGSRPPPG
jgi:DNA-binding MarR family transcriptional regulator/N-acetylglutamate synthase-like GNAT family acetyltransferase